MSKRIDYNVVSDGVYAIGTQTVMYPATYEEFEALINKNGAHNLAIARVGSKTYKVIFCGYKDAYSQPGLKRWAASALKVSDQDYLSGAFTLEFDKGLI